MKLNKGGNEGTISIPNENKKYTTIHYYVKRYKRKGKFGIEGSRIYGLILNTKDDTLAYYAGEKGWVISPRTEEAEIALKILLLEK